MKRVALYLLGGLLFLVLLAGAGAWWLVGSSAGARFLLGALPGATGLAISARGVEGRILDRLILTGVRVKRPKLSAEIDRVELVWEPRRLWDRDLSVRLLALSGVRIQDDQPPSGKEPSIAWPKVPGFARTLTARVASLKVDSLSYRHLTAPPVQVKSLAASLDYRGGNLTLSGLSLAAPQGRVTGEAVAGLATPALRLDLVALPERPVQGMDLLSLQARLLPGRSPEIVAGSVAAAGRQGGAQRLELTGELGLTQKSFLFRNLKLTRPGQPGTLGGSGSLTLTKGEPLLALELTGSDLDLRDQLKKPTRLSGTLSFTGSQSSYRGHLSLSNRGPAWQNGSLAADYRGNRDGLALSRVAGNLLDGRLGGGLEVLWKEGLRVKGSLTGRGLDPGKLAPDWSGRVNLDLAGELNRSVQGVLSGKLDGRLLESRLHGQELRGEVAAAFAGERLRVDRLYLAGRGFDLRGAGELERRLNLAARVQDLSRLVPGAAGALAADGWVRYSGGTLSGGASGQGNGLSYDGVRVAGARFSAALGGAQGYPVQLQAALNGLDLAGVQADTAQLALDGTLARHTLQAQLVSPRARAELALSGGYAGGVWRGELTRFSGRDAVGPWALAAPAALVLSSRRAYLAPLELVGAPGERVEAAADLALKPLSGPLRLSWAGINLSRANSWISGTQVAGLSSGRLDLRLLPGKRVVMAGWADASGSLTVDGRSYGIERLSAALDGGAPGLKAEVDLALTGGSGNAHLAFQSRSPATLALPEQGELALNCSALDLALLRPFLPENLAVDGRLAGLAGGRLLPGRRLDLKGNAALTGGRLLWKDQGEQLDAAFQKAEVSFAWQGGKGAAGRLRVSAEAQATGTFTAQGERVPLERFSLRLDADQSGLRAGVDLSLQGGAALRGSLTSPAPARLALPETGEFALQWGGIDPSRFKAWLPASLDLKGLLAGEARGRLLPGRRLEVKGSTEFSQGRASWQGGNGELNANLRSATLSFAWGGASLSANLTLALAQSGSAQGHLTLPIPARLPVAPDPQGRLEGAFAGRVEERGFLTALFPGVVQESHGDLDLDLRVDGTWQEPVLDGGLKLARAGAYLPSAGIHVEDVELSASLARDQIRIDGFRATSGGGRLEGSALVRLKGWQVTGYSGSLNGERFQTVYLPELQLWTSPKLTFEGDAQRATLKGDLLVPEMLISGPPAKSSVGPSKDVILEGAPPSERQAKQFPILVEGEIRVILGDKVQVKAEGIDATLGGEMDLALKGIEHITSRGEIRVVKGRYRAYGIDLEIVRGRLYYVGGPVDHPSLDILALRTVADVKAGVTVAGPLGSQVVKLYSEPALPDVDIMAYMVLGHPLGSSTDQASLVAGAASSLFSFGQSESLQDQIKDRLGLSVLGLQTVDQSSAGRMGYKEIPVTPTGAAPKTSAGESLLTVGKYLTPKLYLSYGRSLVTGGSLFQLRYDIFKHWQVETQSGSESGADIYYKLEFN